MKIPYSNDPDDIVRRIRASLLDGHDGCCVTVLTSQMADAVTNRLTPLERLRVALKWADYPQWDIDEFGATVMLTHNALRKQ